MTRSATASDSWSRLRRTAAIGAALAMLAAAGGRLLERSRLGPTDQASYERIEQELHQLFDARATTLQALTSRVAASADLIGTAARDRASAQRLFQALDEAVRDARSTTAGITVYGADAQPLAWSGRISDVNRERIDGPEVQYAAPGALGPSLVRVEPVPNRLDSPRIGTIVAEQLLGEPESSPGSDRFAFAGSLVPVSLRTSLGPQPEPTERSFVLRSSGGGLLVEARVRPADITAARDRWRARTRAAVSATTALTLLLCAAPFADIWRRARSRRRALAATVALVTALMGARLLLEAAIRDILAPAQQMALALLFNALLLTALAGLTLVAVERWRLARRGRLLPPGTTTMLRRASLYLVAGALNLAVLWSYERFLRTWVSNSTIDLLRFSLHPIVPGRLAVLFGLLLLHATVIWFGAVVIRLASITVRTARHGAPPLVATVSWMSGAAASLVVARLAFGGVAIPTVPLLVALGTTGLCAAALARPRGPLRKASQAARFFGLYVALLAPALGTYPSLLALATEAKEELVAGTFAPQARNLREELQRQLDQALAEIDGRPVLDLLFTPVAVTEAPTSDQAFAVWSQTALERRRLTSSVELYRADGALASRFALNLPDNGAAPYRASDCQTASAPAWDVIEETWNIIRAARSVCAPTREPRGTIIVRVMLDYRTLPFISSDRPYVEPAGSPSATSLEEAPGNDVEFAAYGWSLAPIYMGGTSVWRLPESVFLRLVSSRDPFWETLPRGDGRFRVYFMSDRGGIYALGYPTITPFDHLINLAELVVLTGGLYILLLIGSALFNALVSSRPATGRTLLRELRSSFYHKLFLAFVAVAIVPATVLALATRDRLLRQFTDGVNESAVNTATVAQRLVEDYAALQQRGGGALDGLDDQVLMLVERAIGEDVNLFNRAALQATSERDLFASRLFPTRTPADVYRSIVLDRMPTFVNVASVEGATYLLAAAPVRAGDSERIVTIPLTLRQRELDRQRDDLDRRVSSAFVLFVLIGAGLGYWQAERIADPVNRLTRATRRIARGDLSARIAATSSDELRRLVEDFNRMAADLQGQRAELERTQRIEAWADMARQVAHDVKNPLTPIQLSAEHALRVNADRGRPLSPVLDECVAAILSQVKLLRQISTEFSSFASSPTPRPEATDVAALIEEVVEPYRAGLPERIAIHVHADAALPEVRLDRTLFARALTNVIENALHAMPGQGRLIISSTILTNRVIVAVSDTGVGMDEDARARIFEPYFSTRAAGTGLGLTIAKRNVELIGGTIAVDSQRGVGTRITITLPAIDPS